MDVLDETERVSEAGVMLKLQRMGFVVDVEEFLKNLRWHGNASQACEDAVEFAIFSS